MIVESVTPRFHSDVMGSNYYHIHRPNVPRTSADLSLKSDDSRIRTRSRAPCQYRNARTVRDCRHRQYFRD